MGNQFVLAALCNLPACKIVRRLEGMDVWCSLNDRQPTKIEVRSTADIDDLKKAAFPSLEPMHRSEVTIVCGDGKAPSPSAQKNPPEMNKGWYALVDMFVL
eukprot:4985535-Amphidinium_carterae.1